MTETLTVSQFKGLRTDIGQKFIPQDYFYSISNFNFDNRIGATKVLFPQEIYNLGLSDEIDGLFQYSYQGDEGNIFNELVVFCGGTLWKVISGNKYEILSGLEKGTATFTTYNNKLYMCNGKNYPIVYNGKIAREMGSPLVSRTYVSGNLSGEYRYEVTYVTTGGEERIFTKSNVISVIGEKASLEIPIGYESTVSRKIYRTKGSDSSNYYLLGTINDNTTTQYIDDVSDSSLGINILDSAYSNNECPKPYFIKTLNERLVCAVIDSTPTALHVADIGIDIFNKSIYEDVSNYGDDNTAIQGIALDYNKGIIGTKKDIYILDFDNNGNPFLIRSRINIGVKNGHSMATIPSTGTFAGGVMFVSTLNDVRLINGNFEQPIATSLDNIRSEDFSLLIRPTLLMELTKINLVIYASFHNYKYNLLINNKILFMDIRGGEWGILEIKTDSYKPSYKTMQVIDGNLYVGRSDDSIIERFFVSPKYKGEYVNGHIKSGKLLFSEQFKFIESITFLFSSSSKKIKMTVNIDSGTSNVIEKEVNLEGNAFSSEYFSSLFFKTSSEEDDYRVLNINSWARFIDWKIESQEPIIFKGIQIKYQQVSNKESV